MTKTVEGISLKKSKRVIDGKPNLPTPDKLVEGEIAINYAEGYETISTKNENGTITVFSSDDYYTKKKLGSGFTGENSAKTVTDAIGEVADELEAHTASTSHMNATEKENLDSLAANIAAISGITAAKIESWDESSVSAHTHDNKAALDAITGNVGTMAYEEKTDYTTTAVTDALNTVVTAHTADTDIHITSAERTAWNDKVDFSDLVNYFDGAKYELSGSTHVINFYNDNTIKATIDATDFIKDGMIDSVELVQISGDTYLRITWNTDAGKEVTDLNIGDIFDADNYYNKTEIDNKLGSGFTVSSVTEVIESNERVVSSALNYLNSNKLDVSAYTPTDLSNYYQKNETSGATELSNAFAEKLAISDFNTYSGAVDTLINSKASQSDLDTLSGTVTAHTADTNVHMNATEKENLDSLAGNIAAISGITSTKVGNWDTAYSNNHTHSNKSALDAITGNVGTMAYENKTSYSSATEVNTALGGKADTATTIAGYGITDAKIESQKITLGSNNVTVSSSTQISTALDNKQDKVAVSAGTGTNSLILNRTTNTASGNSSVAEGHNNVAGGDYSHAEGSGTTAGGLYAHAEGNATIAGGERSHAEGSSSRAQGYISHAEGANTVASGGRSHAEGNYTNAVGHYSHSEGNYTNASNQSEHASGQYNISTKASTTFGHSGNTLFSVGNGTADDARHNAFEVKQNGDIWVNDGTNDVRLQDTILALGGLKLRSISQADYDALAVKDPMTLYIIND